MRNKEVAVGSAAKFGVLSAIWILCCNDVIPEMTYEGIRFRCGLFDINEVKGIVKARGELFRAKVPRDRLDRWKEQMLNCERLPSWILDIDDIHERERVIKELKPEDLFRNQFRAEEDAPQAPLEILKWGLEHIERLRKAEVEGREEERQVWSTIRIPVLSTIIALTAVLGSCVMQTFTLHQQDVQRKKDVEIQSRLKYYEVELKPKLEGYTTLMKSLAQAGEDVKTRNAKGLNTSLSSAESALYSFEPFFEEDREKQEKAKQIWARYRDFAEKCRSLITAKQNPEKVPQLQDSFLKVREDLRSQLSGVLFQPLPPGLL